jgi:hypothetical protein
VNRLLYDIAAFDELVQAAPAQLLAQTSARQSAADLITGPAKAVQRYLLVLLTRRGTVRYAPGAGCTLLLNMDAGWWRIVIDVLQSFHFAQIDVLRQLAQSGPPPTRPTRSSAR